MRRALILATLAMAGATQAQAQPADPHAHHSPAAQQPEQAKPLPQAKADTIDAEAELLGAATTPAKPPPPFVPATLADGVWGTAAMARSREVLQAEHGGMSYWNVVIDRLETRPASGADAYGWEGWARFGGDINRLVVTSEGEGRHGVEAAEAQVLYSRAIGPYFDVQAGVRQDFEPRRRTYATLGVSGLAPYWFEVGAAAFLSEKGEVSGRVEADYDLRLTNRLILQPAAELVLADDSSAEIGARLRYDLSRQFAPYVGVHHETTFGDGSETRAVVGLRLAY